MALFHDRGAIRKNFQCEGLLSSRKTEQILYDFEAFRAQIEPKFEIFSNMREREREGGAGVLMIYINNVGKLKILQKIHLKVSKLYFRLLGAFMVICLQNSQSINDVYVYHNNPAHLSFWKTFRIEPFGIFKFVIEL